MRTEPPILLAFSYTLLAVACAARRVSVDYMFAVTGVVTAEDGGPVPNAEVTLEVNSPVCDAVTPVKTVKRLTNNTGGFVFEYLSHKRGVGYTLTVGTEVRTADEILQLSRWYAFHDGVPA